MTPEQAADLATRTLTAITDTVGYDDHARAAADRERVTSDLDGLVHGWQFGGPKALLSEAWRPVIVRHAANLRRTARLYGVCTCPEPWA